VAYLTNETVLDLPDLPASLAVLGGGAVGCELAQAFARLGARVTLIEALHRLLVREEPESSAVIADVFTREAINLRLGARVDKVTTDPGGQVRLSLGDRSTVSAQRLLVAVGRAPVTDGLDLPAAGVSVDDDGNVVTDYHPGRRRPWCVRGRGRHRADAVHTRRVRDGPPRRRQRPDPPPQAPVRLGHDSVGDVHRPRGRLGSA
jgi:pyruvate/2-oxoglutarate dehydrogenase complex dihydrolipoamide dehydrogenase (E3) component